MICGLFFRNVANDIGGFQNRLGELHSIVICFRSDPERLPLGVFFFTLALFGFSCLSSLVLFANERILFMRERYAEVTRRFL